MTNYGSRSPRRRRCNPYEPEASLRQLIVFKIDYQKIVDTASMVEQVSAEQDCFKEFMKFVLDNEVHRRKRMSHL